MPKRERDREKQREWTRRWRASLTPERIADMKRRRKPTVSRPEHRASANEKRRHKDRSEEYERYNAARRLARRAQGRTMGLPAGVIANAAPSPWSAMLARLTAAAGRSDDADEIAAEAALLVIEGQNEAEAIREARRRVRENARFLRFVAIQHDDTRGVYTVGS